MCILVSVNSIKTKFIPDCCPTAREHHLAWPICWSKGRWHCTVNRHAMKLVACSLLLSLTALAQPPPPAALKVPGPSYLPRESQSSEVDSRTFEANFADGSALGGVLGRDVVTLAGISSAADFGLGDTTAAAGTWHHSGILGLGVQVCGSPRRRRCDCGWRPRWRPPGVASPPEPQTAGAC